jgi:hypothetical protein
MVRMAQNNSLQSCRTAARLFLLPGAHGSATLGPSCRAGPLFSRSRLAGLGGTSPGVVGLEIVLAPVHQDNLARTFKGPVIGFRGPFFSLGAGTSIRLTRLYACL